MLCCILGGLASYVIDLIENNHQVLEKTATRHVMLVCFVKQDF